MQLTMTNETETDDKNKGQSEECPYCWGGGTVKRRYGTVGPVPAKIVKQRECRVCEGSGAVPPEVNHFDD